MRDRRFKHAVRVGQRKLHTLAQRGFQGFFGLEAAMAAHHGFEVLPRGLVLHVVFQQRRIKAPPHQRHGARVVFQQLVVGGQAQRLQHGQGCGTQQGRKPAVEGANLHRAPLQQQGLV